MEILEIRTLRGPNYWSGYWKNLIIMRLDIGEYEKKPTNKIKGFYDRLIDVMPSIESHGCSYGEPGGFLKRVKEGTWAGHAIEHLALELQTLAGMDTGYGRTRETSEKGIYNVVFSYLEEEVGRYAGRAAVRLWLALATKKNLEAIKQEVSEDVQKMREIREDVRFGPSTGSLVEEAVNRDIPYIRLNDQSLVQLGYGINQKRIQATTTVNTNMISGDIAGDKAATKKLLGDMGVPVPKGYRIRHFEDLEDTLERVGYPAVIKPLDGNHGKGATIGIHNLEDAAIAFEKAKEYSRWVIVEQQLIGSDFRALVVNNRLIAVAKRIPAHVVGDGKSTIEELVEETNRDPRRGFGHENVLTLIDIDQQSLRCIKNAGYSVDSVLKKGEVLFLKTTANISTGGTAIDVTDEVHPENVFLFERIARIIGLDVAGIDIIADNVAQPLREIRGGIIEVNAAPGFRMHLAPSEGIGRNVAEHVIDMLFPTGTPARIPIIGITGTNGKTTSAYVIAQAFAKLGRKAAYAGTLGHGFIDAIEAGTHTTPDAVTVHRQLAAVRAAGGEHMSMEVSSHALDQHRVGGVRFHAALFTNLTHDHLDYHGTFEAYGAAKARLFDWPGLQHAAINVDDAFGHTLVFERHHDAPVTAVSSQARPRVSGPRMHALFAERVTATPGGLQIDVNGAWGAGVLSSRFIGAFNADNLLGTLAVLLGHEVPLSQAIEALEHCVPPPGRMETFGAPGMPLVVVDYAHTPDALDKALAAMRRHCAGKLTCVFGCGGDRDATKRPLMGAIAQRLADRVIVTDDNPRTEDGDAIVADILNGMKSTDCVSIERERAVAIERAIREAGPHDAVLIAGKGHEDYQIVGWMKRYFSDRNVVAAVLRRRA